MSETLEVPKYRLNAPYWDNSTLWPEGTTLHFRGTPNEEMVPLNEPAEAKMRAYQETLDRGAELKALMDGKAFVKRNPDLGEFVQEAMGDRPKIAREMPRTNEKVPVRPDMVPAHQRRAQARTGDVVRGEMPEPPKRGAEPPVAILGTTYTDDMRGTSRG